MQKCLKSMFSLKQQLTLRENNINSASKQCFADLAYYGSWRTEP